MSSLQAHCANPIAAGGMPAASRDVSAGWLACDRYRVERLVAWGGMGLVYEATHLALDVTVALKVLRPEFGDCEERVAAFLDEAHWLAALSNEHIVRILDAGRLDTGLPFFTMELLDGWDLRCVLQACGRMAPAVVVQYAIQACSALSEVHELGLVHCDVKPGNLFLAAGRHASARIKLLDFGIARSRLESDRGQHWSSPDWVVGSPLYSSPEQLQAAELDCRTDIWSLGLVLFEMLTGACPFAASSIAETQSRVLNGPTPRLRELRPELDPRLASIVETCLEKDRRRRFSSMAELGAALLPLSS